MFEGSFISENCSFFRILSLIEGAGTKRVGKRLAICKPFVLT